MLSKLLSNELKLVNVLKSLWKDHICTCINVSFASLDSAFYTLDTSSICPCTDNEVTL